MSHPLDKEFDMDRIDDEVPEFIIPEGKEERDLDLIIDFALKAYKQQMDDMLLIDPKNRIKYFEVAERFLGQAKDARYKRDCLILKRELASKKPSGDGNVDSGNGASREALLEQAADVNKRRMRAVK